MKLLFIPNWNGHLFLQEYDDKSISSLYNLVKFKNKELVKIEKNNISKTNNLIEKKFNYEYNIEKNRDFKNKEKNLKILSITGDHSNSYPLIKAFSKLRNDIDFKLIIFDAHPDVEVSTDSISHEDYLRNLIEDNYVDPENIYLFGIRTFSRVELDYLLKKKVNFYSISDILRDQNTIMGVLKLLSKEEQEIYLSIDIDVLDPDDAPGTYYREWCGLKINELEEFIKIIKKKVVSVDVSEYYAEKDDDKKTTQKNILKLINSFIN